MGQDIACKIKQKKGGIATVIISSKVSFVSKSINRDTEGEKRKRVPGSNSNMCGGGEAFSHQPLPDARSVSETSAQF